MSNIEKKLDALIDALGFDVKENKTMSETVKPIKEKGENFLEYKYEIVDYEFIKRDVKPTVEDVVSDVNKEIIKLKRLRRWIY